MSWQVVSVVPVWLLALGAAIAIGVVVPRSEFFEWIAIALAACVIATFGIQLATRRPKGFVARAMASICVAVLILAGASGVMALLG